MAVGIRLKFAGGTHEQYQAVHDTVNASSPLGRADGLLVHSAGPIDGGWGVIDFLRRSKTKAPRIFVITGVKDQTLSVADRELVSGLIYKPLNPDEVDRVVQQSVSGVTA